MRSLALKWATQREFAALSVMRLLFPLLVVSSVALIVSACRLLPAPTEPSQESAETIQGIGISAGIDHTSLPPSICVEPDLNIEWDLGLGTVTVSNARSDCEVRGVALTLHPRSAQTVEMLLSRCSNVAFDLAGGERKLFSMKPDFYDFDQAICRGGKLLEGCPSIDIMVPVFDTSRIGSVGCTVFVAVPKTPRESCSEKPGTPTTTPWVHVVSTITQVVVDFKVDTGRSHFSSELLEQAGDAERRLTTIYESWSVIDPSPALPVDPRDNSITIGFWNKDPRLPSLDEEDLQILSSIASILDRAPDAFQVLNSWSPRFVERGQPCDEAYQETARRLRRAIQNARVNRPVEDAFVQSAQSLRSAQVCLGDKERNEAHIP